MFVKPRIIIVLLFSICITYGQNYRSVDEIKDDWLEHTKFQKQELLSFCDFLINEGHYERALLSLFQYLYKFPNDSLEVPILYHIARNYDLSGNPILANRYYDEVINLTDENDRVYKAAYYRKLLINYYQEDYDVILEQTENETDPYLIIFRGYIFLNDLQWVAARQAFLSADERFRHRHYSSLIAPIMQTIDNAAEVPMKNKWQTLAASIIPGGGRAYLQEWGNAGGALASFFLVASLASSNTDLNQSGDLSLTDNRNELIPQGAGYQLDSNKLPNNPSTYGLPDNVKLSSKNKYLIYAPIALSLSIYLGTILKTYQDVDNANQLLFRNHIRTAIEKTPIDSFMDFMEPNLVEN
ncbi:MAG: hypothetical protein CMG19_02820 [Candidatus Marinimicrobia bacterium]|nr:hypothetical protein [Candidatus Neomarinimicrobiota bacterium]